MQQTSNQTDALSPFIRWFRLYAKHLFILLVSVGLITLLVASVKMVLVAFESQPECITHTHVKNESGTSHRAAKSSC